MVTHMGLAYYKDVDDFLGVRNLRYFGEGYLRTTQNITDFKIAEGGEPLRFTCTGQVLLPEVWSQKGRSRQTPHLSTIDVIELAIDSVRQLFISTRQSDIIRTGTLRNISIIAGNKPVETDLDNIRISGRAVRDSNGSHIIELSIANMNLELVCVPVAGSGLPVVSPGKQPVEVSDVMVCLADEGAVAAAIVTPLAICTNETWSVSSCFAASLQLGQILLYNLDGVDRTRSNTLWMKRTTITFSQELSRSTQLPQPVFTKLENVKKYPKPDGDWRRADIVSVICNTRIVCSVTHRLPDDQQQEVA